MSIGNTPGPFPTGTPNVVIENPKVRRWARTILDAAGVVIGTVMVADLASEAFNLVQVTAPALAVWTYLRAAFGFTVDTPNTPKA